MGFEDYFDNNRSHSGNYGKQNYHNDHNDHSNHRDIYDSRHSYQRRENHFDWMNLLAKIRANKKLKMLVIVAAIVILAIAIILVIALLPLLGRIFTFITQLDLKGLQEYITGLLDKLLKG
jgi:type IV secretory pathway component VirB8